MRITPTTSVLALPAGARAGSYATAASPEHDYFGAQLAANPDFRARALERAALGAERELRRHRVIRALRWHAMRPVFAAAVALGMHPFAPYFALRYGRRGNIVKAIRRRTGLGQVPTAGRRGL